MKTLAQLRSTSGQAKSFVLTFVHEVHAGDWDLAQDHWERTVVKFLHKVRELEGMGRQEATREAENLAQTALWSLAQTFKDCPFCMAGGPQ